MFKKILDRNQPTPTEEPNIQNQIDKLEQEAFDLHSSIMASGSTLTKAKQKLIAERADIIQRISILKNRQLPKKERQALEKIDKLFKEKRYILKINKKEVKPKKGLITLRFIPCGHKKIIAQSELLSYQSMTFTAEAWLAKYQSIFNTKGVMTRSVNCIQCQKAHPSILQGQAITVGKANIELSTF